MRTVHEQSAAHLLDAMIEHPGASRTFIETRRRLKLPSSHPAAFGRDYIATLGQLARITPAQWPLEQVAAFTALHTKICAGEILLVQIGTALMRGGPKADAQRKENAQALARLPAPFHADVDLTQNGGDADGTLKWDAPIRMDAASGVVFLGPCRLDLKQPVPIVRTVADGWAPLEIGSTTPSRTLLHLLEAGAVARWPYGSDHIWLLVHRDGPVVVPLFD